MKIEVENVETKKVKKYGTELGGGEAIVLASGNILYRLPAPGLGYLYFNLANNYINHVSFTGSVAEMLGAVVEPGSKVLKITL